MQQVFDLGGERRGERIISLGAIVQEPMLASTGAAASAHSDAMLTALMPSTSVPMEEKLTCRPHAAVAAADKRPTGLSGPRRLRIRCHQVMGACHACTQTTAKLNATTFLLGGDSVRRSRRVLSETMPARTATMIRITISLRMRNAYVYSFRAGTLLHPRQQPTSEPYACAC